MQNNINKYLNMLLVQQETELLGIALDLKIFKLLESASYTAHSLAKKLESDDHNTKVLLDGLVFMDLLQLNNDIYIQIQPLQNNSSCVILHNIVEMCTSIEKRC